MNFLDHDHCESELYEGDTDAHVWDDDQEPVSDQLTQIVALSKPSGIRLQFWFTDSVMWKLNAGTMRERQACNWQSEAWGEEAIFELWRRSGWYYGWHGPRWLTRLNEPIWT